VSRYSYNNFNQNGKMDIDKCDCRIIHQDKVERARAVAYDRQVIERLSLLFKSLGDPTRLRIICALFKFEMCVCDLAALLEVSESAVSHQLRLLRTNGLVRNRREGTILYYSLNDDHVEELLGIGLEHVGDLEPLVP
jgi:ArsR family transcriptional regulator, lead/cadmium/zinc/bismuth-responsive transcriptional repressor